MKSTLTKLYSWFQWLNLDIVLGAVGWHWAFLQCPSGLVTPLPLSGLVLALILWIIYVLDRILDTYRGQINTLRHQFHHRHQFNLMLGVLSATAVALVFIFFLPSYVISLGLVLAAGVLIYFFIIHRKKRRPKVLKQFFIPIIYGVAVAGTAWVQIPIITVSMWIIAGQWWLVLVQNMGLFRYFEHTPDQSPTCWIRWISGAQIVVFIVFFSGQTTYVAGISGLLMGISTLYSLLPTIPACRTHYRIWIDGLLLSGWLAFWLG